MGVELTDIIKKKMGKKNVDPAFECPKKPMSAYMLFSKDIRAKLKSENPKLKTVAKLTAEAWKEADVATKKKYARKHKKAMEIYESEFSVEDRKKSKKIRDPNAPKRPMSAFFLWFKDNRPRLVKENANSSGKTRLADIGKIAGATWKEMSDHAKKPWIAKAATAKKAYEKALHSYKTGIPV